MERLFKFQPNIRLHRKIVNTCGFNWQIKLKFGPTSALCILRLHNNDIFAKNFEYLFLIQRQRRGFRHLAHKKDLLAKVWIKILK